jgi:hypothetical protein
LERKSESNIDPGHEIIGCSGIKSAVISSQANEDPLKKVVGAGRKPPSGGPSL